MPPKIDQAALIILDVGRNVSTADEKGERSFFEESLACASRIIERKIISQGKNFVGVILLGTKKTKNSMAEQVPGAFKHIELHTELQAPTWDTIRNLPEKPSPCRGDWLDSLVVAADHFKNEVNGVKIMSKRIILMTNFQSPSNLDPNDVEAILNGFKEDNLEVDVIGPDIHSEKHTNEDIQVAKQLVETTNGATAPFEDTMKYLLFHRKKMVNPMPWNVDLSIGPNIKIPVSSYIRLKDEPVVKGWMKAVKDPITSKSSTSESIMTNKVHINAEDQMVVQPTEVIKGYQYGQQIIPFTEFDKTMLYESGEKSLSVYGFTHASNITWQNLNSDGLSYIFGRKGDKKAQNAIRSLVECLHELKLVGIVRRVYNNGNAPKMYALMPVIDTNNFICLSMAGICYKEEIKYMNFPPTSLKKYKVTDEQVNVFKELIEAMDLTKAYDETYDETEAFPIAETVSPSAQYVLDCIAYRAMNPGKPLPQPKDEIMMLFKEPPMIEKRSRDVLDKLKSLFTLHKVETKSKGKKNNDILVPNNISITPMQMDQDNEASSNQVNGQLDNIPKVQMPVIKSADVIQIGTVDPISDFKTLTSKGRSLTELTPEITDVIENLVYCNIDGTYSKALSTMTFFRRECVNSEPSHYNTWILKFKTALNDRKKSDLVNIITENKLGIILKEENSLSTFAEEDTYEDSQLYENDTIPNTAELTINTEVNDMFDEI